MYRETFAGSAFALIVHKYIHKEIQLKCLVFIASETGVAHFALTALFLFIVRIIL